MTITDDESAAGDMAIVRSGINQIQNESGATLSFDIVRLGGPSGAITVDWDTRDRRPSFPPTTNYLQIGSDYALAGVELDDV